MRAAIVVRTAETAKNCLPSTSICLDMPAGGSFAASPFSAAGVEFEVPSTTAGRRAPMRSSVGSDMAI